MHGLGSVLSYRSIAPTHMSGKSAKSRGSQPGGKKVGRNGGKQSGPGAVSHSGERFRAKTGGDKKGSSKVEPYAYWPLDRRMLNKKRRGKQAQASKGLSNIVKGAKAGAAKGRKAKRHKAV